MSAQAPWPDFLGQPIKHGDRLLHPNGTEFVAVRLSGYDSDGDAWRAVYDDATVSRLCLQIGDKGRAVLASMPAMQELRESFERLVGDHDSYGLKRSRRGIYVNPAIARDWKWFQLGANGEQKEIEVNIIGTLDLIPAQREAADRQWRDRRDALRERAARLWPDSTELQIKWLRAVRLVRRTQRGWLIERMVQRTH